MRVFVPSAVKIDRLRTHLWLPNSGMDYTFVVHTDEDAERLAAQFHHVSGGDLLMDIRVCDPPNIGVATIGWIRQWIEDNLVEDGEWYVMLDDDIFVSKLPSPLYDLEKIDPKDPAHLAVDFRESFATPMHADQFRDLVEEIREKCLAEKTILGGITWNDNYFFRLTKWKSKAFVCGGFTVTQKHPLVPWLGDHHQFMGEDTVRCVRVMERFGKIMLNQFATIAPLGSQDSSSIGPLSIRRSAWRETCNWLCRDYPLIVGAKSKPSGEKQLVWKSDKSIQEHRRFLHLI